MFNRSPQTKIINETEIETVCRLARAADLEGLKEHQRNHQHFYYSQRKEDGYTAMRILASEGNILAVHFLIRNFHEIADDAVKGFAEAGLFDEVEKLCTIRKSKYEFINQAEYEEYKVNHYFQVFHPDESKLKGYVRGGHDHKVEEMLNMFSDDSKFLDIALHGYLKAKRWDRVQELLSRGAHLNLDDLSGKFIKDNRERLFAYMPGMQSRVNLLAVKSQQKYKGEKIIQLKDADVMHRLMSEYDLNYDQAKALAAIKANGNLAGVRTWLLQGMQVSKPVARIVNEDDEDDDDENTPSLPLLPTDIYCLITKLVLGMSQQDTKKIIQNVHANLFANIQKSLSHKLASGLFSSTKYFVENAKAVEQFENRYKNYHR
jgi:hypothetical protein